MSRHAPTVALWSATKSGVNSSRGDFMPSYGASQTAELYQGAPISVVNNAATDSGITTSQALAVAPPPNGAGLTVMIVNTTNQQATGQFAFQDTAADYQNLSGCIVPPGASLAYNLSTGWLRFTFAIAPTSGSLVVSR
jgi:hypothetical protein